MKKYLKRKLSILSLILLIIPSIALSWGVISSSSSPQCFSPGNDAYTKLLITGEETVVGGTFTDSGQTGHTMTFNGTQTDFSAAQQKFGDKSLYLDGTGDYLETIDHADWTLGASDFTIDFWARATDATPAASQRLFSHTDHGSVAQNGWNVLLDINGAIRFTWSTTGADEANVTSDNALLLDATWGHIAIVRDGNTLRFFANGVAKGTGDMTGVTIFNSNETFLVGAYKQGAVIKEFYDGYMDEIRLSLTARWTTAFTPPVFKYCE